MAAAFCLCGLFFLYHIDCVNGVRCKVCDFDDPDCNSGNVPDVECELNGTCGLIRQFTKGEPDQVFTIRGCTSKNEGFDCVDVEETWKECRLFCSTDNCNSATNLGD